MHCKLYLQNLRLEIGSAWCPQGQGVRRQQQEEAICDSEGSADRQRQHLACQWRVHTQRSKKPCALQAKRCRPAGRLAQSHLKTMQMITKTQGLDDHGSSFAQNVMTEGAHSLPTDRPRHRTRMGGRLSSVSNLSSKNHIPVLTRTILHESLYISTGGKLSPANQLWLDYTVP